MTGSGAPALLTPETPRVSALLEAVLEVLPESLVCQRERTHLRVAAEPFAVSAGEAVVEIHLGGLSQRDLTVRLWPMGARETLAAARSVPRSTVCFLTAWLRSKGPLSRVPYVELEQDIVNGEPLQWVGPATRPNFRDGGETSSSNEQDYATGLAVLRALPDWPPPNAVLAQFRSFIEQLPAGTRLNMMSSLGARGLGPRAGLRMILSGPRAVALRLAALNEHNRVRAEQLLSRYSQETSIGFDLELVADGTDDYFAFYCRFSNPDWSDAALRAFLDRALGDRLLTREELQGFRALLSAAGQGHSASPAPLKHSLPLSSRGHLALTFKLALRENAPARLKAYVERLVY